MFVGLPYPVKLDSHSDCRKGSWESVSTLERVVLFGKDEVCISLLLSSMCHILCVKLLHFFYIKLSAEHFRIPSGVIFGPSVGS